MLYPRKDNFALVVIAGGAGGMSDEEINRVRPLFVDGLARLAAQECVAILDSGTNSGVMAFTGEGTHLLGRRVASGRPASDFGWGGSYAE